MIVLAILVAGAVVITVNTHDMAERLDHSQRQTHMLATVLNAPDVVMLTGKISTGGTATVVMSHREHALVFTTHGLRTLPAAKCYQLWLMGPHGIRSVGMLKAAPGGMTGPAVVSGLAAGDVIGLTIEPTGGSPQPTSPPIVLIGRG
jgi:anti-sigma-K factor RskA